VALERAEEIRKRLSLLAEKKLGAWTDASIGDVLAGCTPLTLDLFIESCHDDGSVARAFRELGFPYRQDPGGPCGFEEIAARPYLNLSAYFAAAFHGFPWTVGFDSRGRTRLRLHRPERLALTPFWIARQVPSWWLGFRRVRERLLRKAALLDAELESALAPFSNAKLGSLTQAELDSIWKSARAASLPFASLHLQSDVVAGLEEGLLRALLAAAGKPELFERLVRSAGENLNFRCNAELARVARDEFSMKSFLDEFGHRGFPDWELSAPRWREKPELLEPLLKSLKEAKRETQPPEEVSASELGGWRAPLRRSILSLAGECRALIALRESSQGRCYRFVEVLRRIVLEAARRHGLTDELFYLKKAELEKLLSGASPGPLVARARERKLSWRELQRIPLPHMIHPGNLGEIGAAPAGPAQASIKGRGASPGKTKGRALVSETLDQLEQVGPDDIVICRFADPSRSALLLGARGFVMEQGSTLSHIAILAREYGLPSVVGAKDVCSQIRTGDWIEVDADRGTVSVL
jgi:pyruvate,water dikinase